MILQACPGCARQYDVRHLAPGARVRCVCGEEFAVARARELRVRGRRCKNCGGAVGPDLAACPYCAAALAREDRSRMACPSCFAWIAEDARHCSQCGTAIAPQALRAIPAGRDCPRCRGELVLRSLETVSMIECGSCGGMWLDPDVFEDVCRDAERSAAPESPFAEGGERAAFESEVTYIPCLDCGELMQRRQYRHRERSTGVVLDVCRNHGVWLDTNELATVLAAIRAAGPTSAPVPRTSSRPAPVQLTSRPLFERRGYSGPGLLEAIRSLASLFF